jgi:hypothetical protein
LHHRVRLQANIRQDDRLLEAEHLPSLSSVGNTGLLPIGATTRQKPVKSTRSAPGCRFGFIKTTPPAVCYWILFAGTHDNRTHHGGAGSGSGRGSQISRKILENLRYGKLG